MEKENSNVNKDVANSLNKYSDYGDKGINVIINTTDSINNWYEEQINKISRNEDVFNRLETNVDNISETIVQEEIFSKKIETKVNEYDEIQTNNKNNISNIKNNSKIKTQIGRNNQVNNTEEPKLNTRLNVSKSKKMKRRVSVSIKGVKLVNNTTNKLIRVGKSINTEVNEEGIKSFQKSSNRIMTKPVKKLTNNTINNIKYTLNKKSKNIRKQAIKKTNNIIKKTTKLIEKLLNDVSKLLVSLLPSAAILIIIIAIVTFCSFFGITMEEDAMQKYEKYMLAIQNVYDQQTMNYPFQGYVVEGVDEDGRGMINWKAPMSIMQILSGNLTYDSTEIKLLNAFENAGLYENISDKTYEDYEEIRDSNGNVYMKPIPKTKKVVKTSTLDDYINWCNNNFEQINMYKQYKNVAYDSNQTSFTDEEIEQIKLLYSSNVFFDLFSQSFRERYAYLSVRIDSEKIQKIYEEFLQNMGKRYLMDHSNLSYDTCMDYYDCSSWVIHCLAHTGIKLIPNTGADGIYNNYCIPITVDDRQPGDLIFLKNTYEVNNPQGISHIGIYMGELTINGEKSEWVIDTRGKS